MSIHFWPTGEPGPGKQVVRKVWTQKKASISERPDNRMIFYLIPPMQIFTI